MVQQKSKNLRSSGQPAQPKFERNEFYETLLRMKRDRPMQYGKSISAVTQHCVDYYIEQRALAAKKPNIHQAVK